MRPDILLRPFPSIAFILRNITDSFDATTISLDAKNAKISFFFILLMFGESSGGDEQ
jgi:hypothetical protein